MTGSVAAQIDAACREVGFFRITGHGVPDGDLAELDRLARSFFAQPDDVKARIAMIHGGAAWRGWFPLDGELTSGRPDHKEGIYFGTEWPTIPWPRRCTAPTSSPPNLPTCGQPCSAGSIAWRRSVPCCCGRWPSGSGWRRTGSPAT